jgi:hypothetical protein
LLVNGVERGGAPFKKSSSPLSWRRREGQGVRS